MTTVHDDNWARGLTSQQLQTALSRIRPAKGETYDQAVAVLAESARRLEHFDEATQTLKQWRNKAEHPDIVSVLNDVISVLRP